MKLLLYDTVDRSHLFPLTLTRATASLRIGIDTLQEKWERLTGLSTLVSTEPYLQGLYPGFTAGEYMVVCSNVLPTRTFVEQLLTLKISEAFTDEHGFLAGKINLSELPVYGRQILSMFSTSTPVQGIKRLLRPGNLFEYNREVLLDDFSYFNQPKLPAVERAHVHMIRPENIFIHETAVVHHAVLNATDGPIYIGKNATIMEGCLVRGPFALCEGAVLKMGTKIYGATTLGPYCVGGGEIKNSILSGYSNKAHDGYLGDSVIGEWCNLGAGTSNSNLKNNAGTVKVWNYSTRQYEPAGLKSGTIMGDYSRSAINTSFNTGTVVGLCCNVFGDGLCPTFIPDFTWGTKASNKYKFEKAVRDVENWMQLKHVSMDEIRKDVLKHIFNQNKD